MSKGKSGLSLGEYAILGILRERPMHGYDVSRHFGPDRDLALVAPMEMSNIYAMLKDLQELGLIEGEREVVGLRPPRTVFHLTADAEAQFYAWLEEPVGRMREVRSDLLLKLYFCRAISPALTRRLLDAQIVASAAYLDRLTRLADASTPESFERLVYNSKIGAAQAAVRWLQEERERLGG
jgi:DNA-binding PadR family transcriptional regulator